MTKDEAKTPAGDPLDTSLLLAKCAELEAQVAVLQTELVEAKAQQTEAEKFREVAARAQADLQNAKARLDRERDQLGKFAVESLLKRLLPIVDNFQRAFAHLPEALKTDSWATGIQVVEQDMMRMLTEVGLTKISPLGQPADPNRHEILTVGPGPEGQVIDVLEDGYELSGKVLRVAKVRVGDGSKA